MDIVQLNAEISKLKEEMSLLLKRNGSILDHRVIEMSRRLDFLILVHLNEQIKSKAS